ncbi:hypothetical protein BRD00_01865 [Halobacteriales archaeon QS_8_69_26]|nr:MAG: hypothetical protein BRD00_01865 [Halobacteriales archaeon QS_8_69_26]
MTIENAEFGRSGTKLNDRERELITEAIAETDWDETPIVDVVKYRSVARGDDPNLPEYEVHRHAEGIPDYSTYSDPRRKHHVYRLTEDACDEMGIDPETGEPVEDDDGDDAGGEEGEADAPGSVGTSASGITVEHQLGTAAEGDDEDDEE